VLIADIGRHRKRFPRKHAARMLSGFPPTEENSSIAPKDTFWFKNIDFYL